MLGQFIPQVGSPDQSKIKYIILDCRPEAAFRAGHLASSIHITPDLLFLRSHSTDEFEAVIDHLMPLKGQHFCFVSDEKTVVKEKDGGSTEEAHLLSLIHYMLWKGFPFISQVDGGYASVLDAIDKKSGLVIEDLIQTSLEVVSVTEDKKSSIADVFKTDVLRAGLGYGMRKINELKDMKIKKDRHIDKVGVEGTEEEASPTPESDDKRAPSKKDINEYMESVTKWLPNIPKLKSQSRTSNGKSDGLLHTATWAATLNGGSESKVFTAKLFTQDGALEPRCLVLSSDKLFLLQPDGDRIEYCRILSDFDITSLVKITSRKQIENLVVLHFSAKGADRKGEDGGEEERIETHSFIVERKKDFIQLLSETCSSK